MRDIEELHRGDRRLVRRQGAHRDARRARACVGPCPRCDGEIVERPKSYSCTSWKSKADPGCGYTLWKEVRRPHDHVSRRRRSTSRQGSPAEDLKAERVVIGPCPTPGLRRRDHRARQELRLHRWKSRSETGLRVRHLAKAPRAEGRHARGGPSRWCARAATNATPTARRRAARAVPDRGLRRRDRRERAQLRLHLWKSKKKPGCGYVIWKTQRGLGREIGREEAVELIAQGLTSPPANADDAAAA